MPEPRPDHPAVLKLPPRPAIFDAALEGLVRVNDRILHAAEQAGHPIPQLYESGVRYRREPVDVWRHVGIILREGWGDCEDLAGWRAAELRRDGETEAAAVTYKSGPGRYHVVVRRADGTIEDPSRKLGMASKRGPPESIPRTDLGDDMSNISDLVRPCPGLCGVVLGEDDDQDDAQDVGPTADIVEDPIPDMGPNLSVDAVQDNDTGLWRAVTRVPFADSGLPQSTPGLRNIPGAGNALMAISSFAGRNPIDAAGRSLNVARKMLDSKWASRVLPPQAKLALQMMQDPRMRAAAAQVGRFARLGSRGLTRGLRFIRRRR